MLRMLKSMQLFFFYWSVSSISVPDSTSIIVKLQLQQGFFKMKNTSNTLLINPSGIFLAHQAIFIAEDVHKTTN